MRGFLKSAFFTFVVPMGIVFLISGVLFYFADRMEQKEKAIVAANNGFGTAINPLPAGRGIRFENATLRIVETINPANHRISEISGLNGNADPTMKYVMVWLEAECLQENCYGYGFQLAAIDSEGQKYRALTHDLLQDFTADSARYGRELKGWQAFHIPYDSELILFEVIYDRVALYVEVSRE